MSNRRLGSVAAGVAGLTLAARVVGFGRWLVFSKTVGDTCLGDAYNSANNLPNVLFEIVAGGILAGVVVPVIARHLSAGRNAQASRTASALLTWTLLVLTPIALAAMLGAGVYARVFAQPDCAGAGDVVAALVVIFAPQVWFYGLAVISAGLLQADRRFWAAAAAPLVSSVVVISTYLVFAAVAVPGSRSDLGALTGGSLTVLGWGTTLGVVVLAVTTLVPLSRTGLRLRPTLRFAEGDPPVIAAMAGASLAGLIAQQVSVLVAMLAAQQSGVEGAWTRATWANAVYLLPFAVLVSPLQQLAFPRLSAAAEHGAEAVATVLRQVGPALAVLAALGGCLLLGCSVPVARLLVVGPGSGRTSALAWPIAAFAPALLGFSLMGLATRTLFARHQGRRAGVTSVSAWGTVIVAAVVVLLVVPNDQVVTAISLAISLGMLVGAVVGWRLVLSGLPTDHERALSPSTPRALSPSTPRALSPSTPRALSPSKGVGLARPLARGLPIAAVVGAGVAWLARPLAHVGVLGSVLGAVGCALACTVLFAAAVWLLDRRSFAAVLALRGVRNETLSDESGGAR